MPTYLWSYASKRMSGIEIETSIKKGFRVKLRIGNRDIEIQQEKGSSTWIPARGL
jgi:hypothetical protein